MAGNCLIKPGQLNRTLSGCQERFQIRSVFKQEKTKLTEKIEPSVITVCSCSMF